MRYTLFLLVYFYNSIAMAQNYQVISSTEALRLVTEHSLQLTEQLAFNFAFIYCLPDDKFLIMPSCGKSKYSLIVDDETVLNEMIQNRYFPVPDSGLLFEKERDRIHNITQDISYYTNILSGKLQMDVEVKDDSAYFKLLTKALQKYTKHDIEYDEDFIVAIGIYTGEILRRRMGGIWAFRKERIMNPYWVPEVSMHDMGNNYHAGDCWIWVRLGEYMHRKGKFDVQKCIEYIGTWYSPLSDEDAESMRTRMKEVWWYPE